MVQEKSPPKHIIHVGAFVFKDGKLLLGQRSFDEGHLPGFWATPGGKVEIEPGIWNILEKTVHDEVKEEVGIEIKSDMQMFLNNSFTRTDGQPVVSICFICKYKSGIAKPLEDTIDVRWVSLKELDDLKVEASSLKQMKMAFQEVNS